MNRLSSNLGWGCFSSYFGNKWIRLFSSIYEQIVGQTGFFRFGLAIRLAEGKLWIQNQLEFCLKLTLSLTLPVIERSVDRFITKTIYCKINSCSTLKNNCCLLYLYLLKISENINWSQRNRVTLESRQIILIRLQTSLSRSHTVANLMNDAHIQMSWSKTIGMTIP